jgi:NAD+ diphosphatase
MLDGPLPDYAFSSDGHDRLTDRRKDPEFLEAAWRDSRSRVIQMHGRELAVEPGGDRLRAVPPAEAPDGQRMLLGAVANVVYFLIVVGDEIPREPRVEYRDLRALASQLLQNDLALALHSVSLGGWHQRHPRCSVCGMPTEIYEAGASRRCPACSAQHFPRTDPAVIMLVIDSDDRCLLGHNVARPGGWYSTLAGFVEPGETPEQAVRREVREETGVGVGAVRYVGSQPWPFPSALMLGYFAQATTTDIEVDGEEITHARWFGRDELARSIESAEVAVPTRVSIAGALLTRWYGKELPVGPPSQSESGRG